MLRFRLLLVVIVLVLLFNSGSTVAIGSPSSASLQSAGSAGETETAAVLSMWTQRTPAIHPSARKNPEMAYDSARGVSVLFGGDDGTQLLSDTWEWNGTTWSQRTSSTNPPARYWHAMAYDSARHVTVLFGGRGNNDVTLGDTWEWDGTTWTQRFPPASPSARWIHAMAYDSARGVVVLFGGAGPSALDDTWEWNGTTWSQRTPATRPPFRWGHDLAYDCTRAVTVLFGGRNFTPLGDTWEWNGPTWTQRITVPNPPDREVPVLAYDSTKQTTVLFGGHNDSEGYLNDTWEWNGATWTNTTPAISPSARDSEAVAYDSARGVTVMFGGYDGSNRLGDTWEYRASGVRADLIAFVSNRNGNEEIYTMRPDGTGLRNLTNNPAADGHPTWSPDGSRIAFHSNRSGDFEIYTMNADGSNVTRVTNRPGWDGQPSWSPDGNTIAFESTYTGIFEIFMVKTDGTGMTNLTHGLVGGYPAWSPDGSKIVFHSDRNGNNEIYTMNADGTAVTRLTFSPAADWMPSWSPDGGTIAFSSNGDGNWNFYTIGVDGSGLVQLTSDPADDWWPIAWSPDGTKIAFASTRHGAWDIFLMNVNGTGLIRLTDDPSWDFWPAWSRQGGGPNLSISHIEVTQATQDITNTIPLIAGKPTLVRVYLDCGVGCTSMPDVIGNLQASGPAGGVLMVQESATAYHPASWIDQRNDLGKTLNFMVPTHILTGTVTLTATASGVITHETFTFNNVPPLRIAYVSIEYQGAVPNAIRIDNAQTYLESIYPVNNVDYFRVPILESYRGSHQYSEVLAYLNRLWRWYDMHGWPQPNGRPAQLFGWVPHATWGFDGWSDPFWNSGASRVAFGSDTQQNFVHQMTMAHEIAHNLGRRHPFDETGNPPPPDNRCDLGDIGWPYDETPDDENYYFAIHDSGFDFDFYRPGTIVNETTDEFMEGAHCGADAFSDKWISPYTYRGLYESIPGFVSGRAMHLQSFETIMVDQPVLLISGRVFSDTTAELDTAYQITTTQIVSQSVGTGYCLSLEGNGGVSLSNSCFDLSFLDPEWGMPQSVAAFVRVLPYDPAAVRLVLKQGTNELAERLISANPPTVTLASPNGGQVISGTVDVTWTAGDADGDPLTYALSYSADNGQTWYHLGIAITDTHLLIDTDALPGNTQAIFRVMASDGINTASDSSDNVFTVLRHRPEASILSPNEGFILAPGQPLLLRGRGYDVEDGILTDGMLSWTSSLSGDLGSGRTLVVPELETGNHTITLAVTDSDGNTTTTTITIFVGTKVYLPLIRRNQ
jgi:Tol biopolymer transport system component